MFLPFVRIKKTFSELKRGDQIIGKKWADGIENFSFVLSFALQSLKLQAQAGAFLLSLNLPLMILHFIKL